LTFNIKYYIIGGIFSLVTTTSLDFFRKKQVVWIQWDINQRENDEKTKSAGLEAKNSGTRFSTTH